MKSRDDPEVADWLKKSRADREAAELLAAHALPDASAFHCQQAAEKALKGLLVACDESPPFVHNLRVLLDALRASGIDCEAIAEDAVQLTPYAVIARYPGFGETSPDRAREAWDAMERVLGFVDGRFRDTAGASGA